LDGKKERRTELCINLPTAQLEKEMGSSMSYPGWAGIVRLLLQLSMLSCGEDMKKKT